MISRFYMKVKPNPVLLLTEFVTYYRFDPSICAPVGVDYQTRGIDVDNTSICLQFWDTLGQNSFRSISRQFFRKSHAVVIVYGMIFFENSQFKTTYVNIFE